MKSLLVFVLFTFPLFSNNLTVELNNLQKECKVKTVYIKLQKEGDCFCGQGFFIHKDGYVLTAKHLIKNITPESCSIFWIDEYNHRHDLNAELISQHPTQDVALLKVVHPLGQDFPYFEFDSSFLVPGTWVFLSYFDADHINYFLRGGKILHLSSKEINMCIRTFPGDSGSPYALLNGKVIGIHYGSNYITNICIPFSLFNSWLFSPDSNFSYN